jgi:hypothetical protein
MPTGFAHRSGGGDIVGGVGNCCAIHLVPYSEHSSNAELEQLVRFLRPASVVPSVYEDEAAFEKLRARFQRFTHQTAAKRDFFKLLAAGATATLSSAGVGSVSYPASGAAPDIGTAPASGASSTVAAAAKAAAATAAAAAAASGSGDDDEVQFVGFKKAGTKRPLVDNSDRGGSGVGGTGSGGGARGFFAPRGGR